MPKKGLRPQQAPLQQRLHVAPSIGDEEHVDVAFHHPVDDAVGLEEDFTVLPNPEFQQFFRIISPVGIRGQAFEDFFATVSGPSRKIVSSRSRAASSVN